MRKISLCFLLLLVTGAGIPWVQATEMTVFGGFQKPGSLSRGVVVESVTHLVSGDDFGGTFGIRFSSSRMVGFEQTLSISPRFVEPGLKAFQLQSNLIVQAPGKISPYVTVGIGSITTWGGDIPSLGDLIHFPTGITDNPVDLGDLDGSVFDFGTKFAINYGGGIKIRNLAGTVGLRLDVRGTSVPSVFGSTLNFVETSAGLLVSW